MPDASESVGLICQNLLVEEDIFNVPDILNYIPPYYGVYPNSIQLEMMLARSSGDPFFKNFFLSLPFLISMRCTFLLE